VDSVESVRRNEKLHYADKPITQSAQPNQDSAQWLCVSECMNCNSKSQRIHSRIHQDQHVFRWSCTLDIPANTHRRKNIRYNNWESK